MSFAIDQKVVEMRFDNQHFENNVRDSLSTLDKLKQSLRLDGASKGLENVGAAAKGVDFSGLSGAVGTVTTKISALGIFGVTTLTNLANTAVNAGKRIVSALTIDPIKTGFSEYETKINAIQTIMSNTQSKGKTMDDVTKVLGDLNTYADKTIYNFAEMTRNIGTFTAAGVGLEESATAIKGIANLAAMSGSTSQQASTAMYQLSQAMASGTVKLMDWNSVVNAGMGGELFQNALKETAKAHGVAVDALIEKNGSFRESLREGWITTDILTETLAKMTKSGAAEYLSNLTGIEQSQITAAQKLVDENKNGSASYDEIAKKMAATGKITKEQAIDMLKMADNAEDAATKVKTFTQLWDTLKESAQSGWAQTWEIIVGDFEEAKETLTKISDMIGGMIGAAADARNKLLQGWKDAGGRKDLIDSLFNAFNGVMSVVKPIKEAFREIFPPLTVKQLVGFTKGLKELTAKLTLSDKASENLKRTFKGVFAILDIVKQAFSAVFKAIAPLFGGLDDLGGSVLDVTASWGDWLVALSETIRKTDVFGKAANAVAGFIRKIIDAVKALAKSFKENFMSPALERLSNVFSTIQNRMSGVAGVAGKVGAGLSGIFEKITSSAALNKVSEIFSALIEGVVIIGDGLSKALGKANFSSLFDLLNMITASGIGVFIAKMVKNFADATDSFSGFGEGVLGILDEAKNTFQAYQTQLKAGTLLKIASAIGILAASLFVIAMIDSEKLFAALSSITVLFAELMGSLAIFSKISGNLSGVTKAVFSMIGISVAIVILAGALKKIADLKFGQMMTGLIGIIGLSGVVVGAAAALGSMKKTAIKGAFSMILFATAINILASACVKLGALDWSGIAKGLVAVGVLMTEITVFAALNKKNGSLALLGASVAMIAVSAAMLIMAKALQEIATISWGDLAKGLVAVTASVLLLSSAVYLMSSSSNMISASVGLLSMCATLLVIATTMKKFGSMSWTEIGKGITVLGGSLAILALGVMAMSKTISGSMALLVAASALAILAPILMMLGGMSWESIGKGLVTIAGALTIFGVAGLLLGKALPAIIGLAGAFAAFSVGVLAIGAGLFLAGTGLSALAVGLAALIPVLGVVIRTMIEAIPQLLVNIGKGIVGMFEVIRDGADMAGEAFVAILLAFIDSAKKVVPALADGLLVMLVGTLEALGKYTPQIVGIILQFLVDVLNELAANLPDIVQAVVNVLMALFDGVIKALQDIDTEVLVKGLIGTGLLSGLIAALAGISGLIPPAMLGVLGMGAVIAELGLVLSAIGALAQLPGLSWLVGEGGKLVIKIGSIVAEFAGTLISSFGAGLTSGLPQIATNLSKFMDNLDPFIEGAKRIDASVLEGTKALVGVVLALTAANVAEAIASWVTGESSLVKFGEDIAEFAPYLREYADTVAGIDADAILASVKAASGLALLAHALPNSGGLAGLLAGENDMGVFGSQLVEFGEGMAEYSKVAETINSEAIMASVPAGKALSDLAASLPNSGGVAGFFAGENDMDVFGTQLVTFGEGLAEYSKAAEEINSEAIIASVQGGKALAALANVIPNEGGVVSWFAGENSIAAFGGQLVALGEGLAGFSNEVTDINPENMIAAANAAKAIAQMADYIPNEGGVVSWFAGENSIAAFGGQLVALGAGLKGFSDETTDIVPENIIAAAGAAKALAQMVDYIPNEGGVVSWFTGDNSLSKFGNDLIALGKGLKGFSDETTDIVPENIVAASNAAKAIAQMADYIPNEGGVVSWFAGENSISKFGGQLTALGKGLKGFSTETADINTESVTAAANAAKTIAQMASYIPNEGGVVAWFAGENSIASFGSQLTALGKGLKGFSDETTDINPESVTAAANAAKTIAQIASYIPNEGGVIAWLAGEQSIASFGSQLTALGKGLKSFSDETTDIIPENVTAAANAAKALAQMASYIPNEGGIVAWFAGENSVATFANKLPTLGKGLKGFADEVDGINPEAVSAAANAAKSLAQMADTVPKNTSKIITFGENLVIFGGKLKSYFSKTADITGDSISASKKAIDAIKEATKINGDKLKSIASAINDATKAIKKLTGIKASAADNFTAVLKKIAEASVKKILEGFKDLNKEMKKVGESAMKALADGVDDKVHHVKTACTNMVSKCAAAIKEKQSTFAKAGAHLVAGFANGISENTYKAKAKAKAMAAAAAKAAKEELDEHSPSKVGYEIGDFFGMAFVGAIGDWVEKAYSAGTEMAASARTGLGKAINKINAFISSGMDAQPTIRPVLDLSDVASGAGAISEMFGARHSVGVMANVGSISSMMNRNQNGANDDIISALKDLKNTMRGDTYSINGINVEEGSDVADAIKTIVRAAKIERRV